MKMNAGFFCRHAILDCSRVERNMIATCVLDFARQKHLDVVSEIIHTWEESSSEKSAIEMRTRRRPSAHPETSRREEEEQRE